VAHVIATQLAGLNIGENQVKTAALKLKLFERPADNWESEDIVNLSQELRRIAKPIIIATNKRDVASPQNLERIEDVCQDVVATSGAAELALRLAHQKGLVNYVPGNTRFVVAARSNQQQRNALERLQKFIEADGTGVQTCLNKAVFDVLRYIVVYPVEDEHQWSDKEGRVLPDAFLIKEGENAKNLAFKVHSDIGRGFIYAVDARTKKRLGEHHVLQNGDIIKIVASSRAK
jgi:ribosome-binding ATPase YchF (GTP1/OBG family)